VKWARREVESKTGLKVGKTETHAGLEAKAKAVLQQTQDTLSRARDMTKKLGEKVGGTVEEVVAEVKTKADKVLETEKKEEPPKRLV